MAFAPAPRHALRFGLEFSASVKLVKASQWPGLFQEPVLLGLRCEFSEGEFLGVIDMIMKEGDGDFADKQPYELYYELITLMHSTPSCFLSDCCSATTTDAVHKSTL